MTDRERLLKQIQEYKFTAYDMLLYLDTHPTDKAAFELYKSLVKKLSELKKTFEKSFGPLDIMSAAEQEKFNWIESPWPWQRQSAGCCERAASQQTNACACDCGERR